MNKRTEKFLKACQNGETKKVSRALRRFFFKADPNSAWDNGTTALMHSARNGHLNVAKVLIEKGANINAKNDNGETALMSAVEFGHFNMVKYLIENNADVNIKDDDSKSAFDKCFSVWNDYKLNDIQQIEIAEYLYKNGVVVDIKSDYLKTIFLAAAQEGKLPIIKLFIEYGVNIHTIDRQKFNAISIASITNHPEIVKLLIEKGASVNSTKNGTPILSLAVMSESYDVVRLLLENGADPNMENKGGHVTNFTPLMFSFCNDYMYVQDITKRFNEQISKRENNGCPLIEMISLLVEFGADINKKNEHGDTAIMYAAQNGVGDVIFEFLLNNGANVYQKNNNGETAYSIASDSVRERLDGIIAKRKC